MKTFLTLLILPIITFNGHAQALWFNDVKDTIEISSETANDLLIDIKKYLNRNEKLSNLEIYTNRKPRIVFLSLRNKDKPATVALGSGYVKSGDSIPITK